MQVGLFVTCLVDMMRPGIGFSAIKLLEAAGCQVVVPKTQTCCGQPGYNSGDRKAARALAEKTLKEFSAFEYIVAPSGSCAGMIRTHYADLFRDEPELLKQVNAMAARTYELTDFLVNVAKIKNVPGKFAGTMTYHDSCSGLRELGVKQQPRELLNKLNELPIIEMKDCQTCCGFGGTFAVKYGNISTAMVDEKCSNIRSTGADAVVLGDLGCMLNIEGRLRRLGDNKTQVLHVAEVLAGEI
jgi:L-lactate dehydrogenase complex protein LldE